MLLFIHIETLYIMLFVTGIPIGITLRFAK